MTENNLFFENLEKTQAEISHKIDALKLEQSSTLDDLFDIHHEAVFEKTDCLTCANCCRNYSPIIEQEDIARIQKALNVDGKYLFDNFIEMDEDGDFVFKAQPCPMLDLDTNKCTIYIDRPNACAEYPHTKMKRIKTHLELLETNATICPAANEILDKVYSAIKNNE
jgi:Fe-S-cluster containining protein